MQHLRFSFLCACAFVATGAFLLTSCARGGDDAGGSAALEGVSLDDGLTVNEDGAGEGPNSVSYQSNHATPCEGNNFANDNFLDNVSMGGPLVGIEWTPAASVNVTRIEVFTGEGTGANALSIWDDGGGQPGTSLGNTADFNIVSSNGWQGADLAAPVAVTAGTTYWMVWDPAGGEQAAVTADAADVQQTYWGSFSGDVTGGASWFGPFSFNDRRWKFRMFCGQTDSDGDGVPDADDLCPDTVIPEGVPTDGLNPNHWALVDGDGEFDTETRGRGNGPGLSFSIEDTGGCSCEQIIDAQGLGNGHRKHGCSNSAMLDWVALVGGGSGSCGATVDESDPLFARYEGIGFDNACTTDADCVVGGCSSEVCAAEPVFTTCELIPLPSGTCGCVDGACVWNDCP